MKDLKEIRLNKNDGVTFDLFLSHFHDNMYYYFVSPIRHYDERYAKNIIDENDTFNLPDKCIEIEILLFLMPYYATKL